MKNKKFLKALAALTVGGVTAAGLMFGGCAHKHTYSEDWKSDASGHWHYATCDDLKEGDEDYKSGFAAHDFGNDDECDVCHYVRTPAVTEYTVTLDANGGTLSGSASLTTVNGKIATLPTPAAPAGHVFLGWFTAKEDGQEVTATHEFKANATIYARYVAEYTITLNANGGTLAGAATVKARAGKLAELPAAPEAASEELTFKGWFTAAEGGAEVTLQTVFDKDATIYAQWRATDGLYTSAGKLIYALEWVEPGDSALKQYGASGIELSAGDTFVLKLEGSVLTHAAGSLELWLAANCHGVNFNQSEGTFTVKAGDDRAFDIYAKYYEDNTPCWSIYINDGLTDELHAGGAYLVGSGWADGNWDISAENYIDPVKGLTVTLTKDASFKITDCLDVAEGDNRGWAYNDKNFYKVKNDAEGYLNFGNLGASGNGAVLTPGEYTITIEEGAEEGDILFVFTPAEGLQPAPVEGKFTVGGYYLVGQGFTVGGTAAKFGIQEGFEIGDAGITVELHAGDMLKAVICTDAVTGGSDSEIWKYNSDNFYRIAVSNKYAGQEIGFIVFEGGNNVVKAAGRYTVTVDKSGDNPLFIITPADDVVPIKVTEKFTVGGYYLVGQGFTVGGTAAKFGIQEGFEIGDAGITVDLHVGDMLKAVICTNAYTGGSDSEIWKYNEASFYRYAGNETALVFEGGNNVVKTAGRYTVTVDKSGDTPVFVITFVSAAE